MAAMLALPNNANLGTSAATQPLGLVFDHKFDGISYPLQVFQPFLGPDHPGCISVITIGLFREISFWWRQFADHSTIVFTPRNFRSRPPINPLNNNGGRIPLWHPYYTIRRRDSLSICGECARTLSIRTCDGTTIKSHCGCDFHKSHPDIPFAYRRRAIYPPSTSFLRDMKAMLWNHRSQVDMFYLCQNPIKPEGLVHTISPSLIAIPGHPLAGATLANFTSTASPSTSDSSPASNSNSTDPNCEKPEPSHKIVSLRNVTFLRDFRVVDERARLPRVSYTHTPFCLHGTSPECIIQGSGIQGLYYQQCDGTFANAVGEVLEGATGVLSPLQKKRRGDRATKLTTRQGQAAQAAGEQPTREIDHAAVSAAAMAHLAIVTNQPRDFRSDVIENHHHKPSPSIDNSSPSSPSSSSSATSSSSSSSSKNLTTKPHRNTHPPRLDPSQTAESAWRLHHPTAGPNTWREIEAIRKREALELARQLRAQRRREVLPSASGWVGRKGEGVKELVGGKVKGAVKGVKEMVGGKVEGWVLEGRVGFWGA